MRLPTNDAVEALELVLNHTSTGLDGLTRAYMEKHTAEIVLAVAQARDAGSEWLNHLEELNRMEATSDEDKE